MPHWAAELMIRDGAERPQSDIHIGTGSSLQAVVELGSAQTQPESVPGLRKDDRWNW